MSKKRNLAVVMVLVMLLSLIPCEKKVLATSASAVQIIVESKTASPGSEITVGVSMSQNPGILGAELKLDYSTDLKLTEVKNGEALQGLVFTEPGKYISGCKFIWDGQDIDESKIKDGELLSLTFTVAEDVTDADELNVNITCENMIDANMSPVETNVTNGVIKINSVMLADVNNDSKINTTDIILTRRYLAGGYDVSINTVAADVNGDSKANTTDIILIRRYIAGGYGVEFTQGHSHKMSHIDKVAATCTETGNIEYWECSDCGKYFTDPNAVNEILSQDIVIESVGHTPVVDAAVAPTTEKTGLTEGSHCNVCDAVLVKQEIVDKLPVSNKTSYAITYNIYEDDSYLKSLEITNNNPSYYYSEDGLKLVNLKVEGYIFEGWYDGEGSNAELIKQIPAGETGDIELYAHWTPRTYEVTFDSPLVPMDSITYTVNKGATLTNPSWFGYNFMGWSDEKGNVVTRIPKGTADDITLTANWTSKRNQTRVVEKLDAPIEYENEELGEYLFVYEIGQIENVPLYTIKQFNNKMGLEITDTFTRSESVSQSQADGIVNTLAEATTKTNTWTLSNEWNDNLTEIVSHTDESGQEIVDSISVVDSGSQVEVFNRSEGGTDSRTDTKVHTDENQIAGKINLGFNTGIEGGGTIGAGSDDGGINGSITAKGTRGFSVGGEGSKYHKWAESSTTELTKVGTWSEVGGYEDARSSSISGSTMSALSKKVSNTYGYNKSHSEGGSETVANSASQSSSNTKEFSTSFVYSTEIVDTTTITYSDSAAPEGYYRLVRAGTVHVFGVVGYNLSTRNYYAYTFGVQDDETYDYVDYSKNTPNFDDYENGVVPFEVPYYVHERILELTARSEGLIVDKSTGHITGYTGEGKDVIIPDYITMESVNGEPEVVKIVGVDKGAFSGNTEITSVKFGKYVTNLPDSLFEGCTSLKSVESPSVTQIGAKAFYGCTSLNDYSISDKVTSIGAEAFKDVSKINITPASADLVQVACSSGAKDIILNITGVVSGMENSMLSIPSTTEYVELNGGKETFKNLVISSKAETTVINKMNIVNEKGVPLTASSGNIKLSSSSMEAPNWSMILSSDSIVLTLDGTVSVTSSGTGAILTKDITLSQLLANSKAQINVIGSVYVCDEIVDNELLSITNGEIVVINEDSFESLSQDSIEWVLESEVPSGAHILEEKWTYDQITTATSDKDTLEGYTLYDSSYVWSNYGSWSGWSTSQVSASDSRQVETKSVPATYRTQYLYSRYGSNSNGSGNIGPCPGTWGGVYCQYYIDTGWIDSPKSVSGTQYSSQMGGYFNLYDNNQWFNEQTRQVVVTNAYTQYRYRDRSKIYTYYFKKTESKESDTEVKESNEVTNVQKWVKYVAQ